MVQPLVAMLVLLLPQLARLLLCSPLPWVRAGIAATAPVARLARPFVQSSRRITAMKFGYTIAYVADVEASIAFCERAFGLARGFVHESGAYGELATGATTLAFAQHDTARGNLGHDYVSAETSKPPLGIEVGLVTDHVEAAYRRAVQAGAAALAPPQRKPWGQTVAFVRCPDGLLVELCTPAGN